MPKGSMIVSQLKMSSLEDLYSDMNNESHLKNLVNWFLWRKNQSKTEKKKRRRLFQIMWRGKL